MKKVRTGPTDDDAIKMILIDLKKKRSMKQVFCRVLKMKTLRPSPFHCRQNVPNSQIFLLVLLTHFQKSILYKTIDITF